MGTKLTAIHYLAGTWTKWYSNFVDFTIEPFFHAYTHIWHVSFWQASPCKQFKPNKDSMEKGETTSKISLPLCHWYGWYCREFPYIHPSITTYLVRSAYKVTQTLLLPSYSLQLHLGNSKMILGQIRYLFSCILGLALGLLPDGHAWNTSTGRHPGSIQLRYLNNLNWLFPMEKSSSSSSSPYP